MNWGTPFRQEQQRPSCLLAAVRPRAAGAIKPAFWVKGQTPGRDLSSIAKRMASGTMRIAGFLDAHDIRQESGDDPRLIVLRPVRGVWHDMKRWGGEQPSDLACQGRVQVPI